MSNKLRIIISIFLIILIANFVYPNRSIIYTINELNDSDTVYENFIKDILVSKKFKKIQGNISLKDLVDFGNLPKFKLARYKIKEDDNIVSIASRLFLKPESLISVNRYKHISEVKIGNYILIPNMRGILHTIEKNTTIESIAELYGVSEILIMYVNELEREKLYKDEDIFIPNGTLSENEIEDFLGRVFLVPLSEPDISSPYGMRKDPFTGEDEMHYGIDYRASIGESVYSSQYGIIKEISKSDTGYGNLIVVQHKDDYSTYYAHLSLILVEENQYVQTGQKIGEVGNTGRSTGPHLHFEIRKDNISLNPLELDNYGKDKPSFANYLKNQKSEQD